MRLPGSLKFGISLAFVSGLGLFIGLLAYNGFNQIFSALMVVGWGMFIIAAFHLIPLFIESIGWWVLFPGKQRPRFLLVSWARWIGESIDTMLPVAQVGGDIVKTTLLIRNGLPGMLVGATVVVDLTITIATQAVFSLIGLAILIRQLDNRAAIYAIIAGIFFTFTLIAGFYFSQRKGFFGGVARIVQTLVGADKWKSLVGDGEALDRAITGLYRQRSRIINSTFWLFMGWIWGAGEIWLGLYFLGHEVNVYQAIMIESLIQAMRAIVFIIPWAVGVQEGTFLILGTVIGISAEVSIALALLRRVRELCIGIPGLIAWQVNTTLRVLRMQKKTKTIDNIFYRRKKTGE